MIHELKIIPQFFQRIKEGSKTFEIRLNDKAYQSGDTVIMREYDPEPITSSQKDSPRGFTDSPPIEFKIGFIQVLDKDVIAFSLLPIKKGKS